MGNREIYCPIMFDEFVSGVPGVFGNEKPIGIVQDNLPVFNPPVTHPRQDNIDSDFVSAVYKQDFNPSNQDSLFSKHPTEFLVEKQLHEVFLLEVGLQILFLNFRIAWKDLGILIQ